MINEKKLIRKLDQEIINDSNEINFVKNDIYTITSAFNKINSYQESKQMKILVLNKTSRYELDCNMFCKNNIIKDYIIRTILFFYINFINKYTKNQNNKFDISISYNFVLEKKYKSYKTNISNFFEIKICGYNDIKKNSQQFNYKTKIINLKYLKDQIKQINNNINLKIDEKIEKIATTKIILNAFSFAQLLSYQINYIKKIDKQQFNNLKIQKTKKKIKINCKNKKANIIDMMEDGYYITELFFLHDINSQQYVKALCKGVQIQNRKRMSYFSGKIITIDTKKLLNSVVCSSKNKINYNDIEAYDIYVNYQASCH